MATINISIGNRTNPDWCFSRESPCPFLQTSSFGQCSFCAIFNNSTELQTSEGGALLRWPECKAAEAEEGTE
jgi:hypothetical protein